MSNISSKIEKILDDSGMLEKLKRAGIIKDDTVNLNSEQHAVTSRNSVSSASKSLEMDFQQALTDNQCKWESDNVELNNSHRYYFDFQGGHFIAVFYKPYNVFELLFLNVMEVSLSNINAMRSVINKFNNISIHHKFFYSKDPEDMNFCVHISMTCYSVEHLSNRLESFFSTRRDVVEALEEAVKKSNERIDVDLELDYVINARETFLLQQQELNHQAIAINRTNESEFLTVGNVIEIVSNRHQWQLNKAQIVVDDDITVVDDDIASIPLHRPLGVTLPGVDDTIKPQFEKEKATIIIDVTEQNSSNQRQSRFIISLTTDGSDGSSLYYRVQVLPPVALASRDRSMPKEKPMSPQAYSFLVAYDVIDPQNKIAEFNYMWKEAQMKDNEKNTTLTDEEELLCQMADPDDGFNLYWGRRYFTQGRYFEALRHFENTYRSYRMKFFNLSNDAKDAFFEICYYIGFCYNELGLYEKAYFYLNFMNNSSRITYCMELVNTLVNVGDIRSFQFIDHCVSQVLEQYGDVDTYNEEAPDHIKRFMTFLRRRRAFAGIDYGDLDNAEKEFKELLEDPESHDYAIGELAYIKRLRDTKQEAKLNDTTD